MAQSGRGTLVRALKVVNRLERCQALPELGRDLKVNLSPKRMQLIVALTPWVPE